MDAKHVVDVLNRVHSLDSTVLAKLISYRVECNAGLSDDPTVQVGLTDAGYEVGLLGIINGLVGVDQDGSGFISAAFDKNGTLKGFVTYDSRTNGPSKVW